MEGPKASGFRFADFRVDLVRHTVTGPDGVPLTLSGRAYDVLLHLVEHRDRVVSKDELLKVVWPRMVVEENNLNQAISTLRRVLGDSRETPRFIRTVAGRGYRFIADVIPEYVTERGDAGVAGKFAPPPVPVTNPTPALSRRWLLAGLSAAAAVGVGGALWSRRRSLRRPARDDRLPQSIAVLPLKPLLKSRRDEAFELGMAETLINRLSDLPGVTVKPLSSVRRYADPDQDPIAAGRELGVDAVFDGSVQVDGNRVRLTGRLLEVADGTALWSGGFNEKLDDFFAMQDSLATQVVGALAIDLSAEARQRFLRRPTEDVEAWQLYLNGRYQWERKTEDGFLRAIDFYEAAVRRDPRFALPVVGVADAWAVLGVMGIRPPSDVFPRARTAAQRAIHLDPGLGEAYASLGHVLVQYDRDWNGGEQLYKKALAIKPTYAQAIMWTANNAAFRGNIREAIAEGRRSQALEPMSVTFAANVGLLLYYARDFDAAYTQLAGLAEAAPQASLPRDYLARVHMAQGRPEAALKLLGPRPGPAPGAYSNLGRALALGGHADAARAEVARVMALGEKGFAVGYDLALIYAALGEHDAALAALERGVGDHSQTIGFLNLEPALDPIRDEPRFRAVARQLAAA